jgi:adenine-specific DNA-methyltransferase
MTGFRGAGFPICTTPFEVVQVGNLHHGSRSLNYIGSKQTLLPFIEKTFREIREGGETSFCDIFAGTGAVGRHFKRLGLRVIANDIQHYAYVLNRAYLEINRPPAFERLRREAVDADAPATEADPIPQTLAFVSGLRGRRGFIAAHYSPAGRRQYYTEANARKADAIRQSLDEWRGRDWIDDDEYYYLLASLLEAIDQVANTASVYGAYLKQFKSSARRALALKPLDLSNHIAGCRVFQSDANELIRQIECDVLYLDPPYNHRQYGANYHVLETIAAYDNPALKGLTGLREYARSRYCRPGAAAEALADLVRHARTKHILMSYNDEGVLSLDEVRRILALRGTPHSFEQAYTRFKADNGRAYKRDATIEYLHYVRVIR